MLYARYGKYTIYRRNILYIDSSHYSSHHSARSFPLLSLRSTIPIIITPLGHHYRHHHHSARPSLSSSSSLRSAIAILIIIIIIIIIAIIIAITIASIIIIIIIAIIIVIAIAIIITSLRNFLSYPPPDMSNNLHHEIPLHILEISQTIL